VHPSDSKIDFIESKAISEVLKGGSILRIQIIKREVPACGYFGA
jgi:hypothetical protein